MQHSMQGSQQRTAAAWPGKMAAEVPGEVCLVAVQGGQ